MSHRCRSCEFWDEIDDREDPGMGYCRVDPPRVMNTWAGWPITIGSRDWCGEWMLREGYDEDRLPDEPDDAGKAEAIGGENAELEQIGRSECLPSQADCAEDTHQS